MATGVFLSLGVTFDRLESLFGFEDATSLFSFLDGKFKFDEVVIVSNVLI